MASALIGALVATATQVGAAVIGGATLSSIGFTAIAKTFLLTFAVGAVFNAFAPKPNQPVSSGYSVTNRGGNRDHQIIYGKTRVAGTIVVERLSGEGSTGGTRFLHRVIALAGHEVDGYESVYIDGKWVKNWYDPSTSSVITNITPYIDTDLPLYPNAVVELDENGAEVGDPEYPYLKDNYTTRLMAVRFWSGSDTQLASTAIQTEAFQGDSSLWGANHRLRGIAYIHVWAGFDQDAFRNGPPEVQPVVRGKKIYDPRTLTTAWSDNPALVIRDYLVSNYGLKEETVRIDDTIFTAAANACEVNANNGEDFYTCNGSFLTSEAPYDIINNLLTSYNGLLWYPQGKWRTKAGVWTSAVESFNEDDLRAPVSILTRHSRRTNFNTITGSLRGPETDYAVTEFPPVTNASFITEDNGLESSSNVDLPFTDNMDEARRIARIILERNRLQKTINLVVGLKGFKVQVGDVINLSLDRFGWSNKTFEVQAWTFGLGEGNDLQVSMILREIQSSVFDEVDDGVTYSGPFEPQLPEDIITDITPVWVSNNVVFEDYNGGTQLPVIKSRWSVADINAVDYFEYQYRVSSFDYSSNGGKATLSVTPTDREQGIWDAYAGVLGRVPDQDGFTFYNTGAGSGLTIPEVRDDLADTAEFSSQEDFVTQTVTTQRTEIRGLTEEETYDVRVRSIAPSGLSSAWIAENVELVADTLAPNPPTSFTVVGGYQQNILTWVNPTTNTDSSILKDLKEIVIYASQGDTTPDTNDTVFTITGSSFVHGGLGDGETWYYRLKAVDYNGNYSTYTAVDSATTDTASVDGTSVAVVTLYQKNTSTTTPPSDPSGTFTYTFSSGSLTGGTFNGWSQSFPNTSAGEYVWVIQATASSTGTTDTIDANEFSAAVVISGTGADGADGANGADGADGADGLNTATVFMYQKNTSGVTPPTDISDNITYTFSSGAVSPDPTTNGWTAEAPTLSKGEYLWRVQATASNTSTTDTVSSGEFSAPVVVGIGGEDGADGPVGNRGAGRWHIDVDGVTYNNAGTTAGVGDLPVDSDDAQEAWDEGVGNQPTTQVEGDQAWFYQGEEANPTAQAVWIYDGSVWNEQDEVIDGNLLVTDTITTSKLYIKDTSLVYLDTFESETSINEWESFSGLGSRTIETGQTDTELGGNALRVTGGSQIMAHDAIIPFNPNLTYKMTVRAKEVGGTTSFSAGWLGVAADGTTLVDVNGLDSTGNPHTHVLNADPLSASYTNYVGYTKGYGATVGTTAEAPNSDSPGEMHPDVRYFRPFIKMLDTSSQDVYIDSIVVEVMTDAGLIVDGTITGDKIVANTITGGLLATTNIITDSAQIGNGLITNAKIGNLEVDSAKIANLTVGTGKITDNATATFDLAYYAPDAAKATVEGSINSGTPAGVVVDAVSGADFIATLYTVVTNSSGNFQTIDFSIKLGGTVQRTGSIGVEANGGKATCIVYYADTFASSGDQNFEIELDLLGTYAQTVLSVLQRKK